MSLTGKEKGIATARKHLKEYLKKHPYHLDWVKKQKRFYSEVKIVGFLTGKGYL